jgi:RNA polymerase sigma-70 factor (ECF subfamily)
MVDQVLTLRAAGALSDEQVIERVLAGETALYEVVMRRYNTRLYRVAHAILKNDAEAEDVMQDAYVRAFQHLDQFAGRAKFSTWLTRIAVHEALARVHKAKRFEAWDDMNESKQDRIGAAQTRSNPESEAASGELSRLLEEAIEKLPENYRTVVMMRDVEEMSTSETAECLSITEDNVKIRLHRPMECSARSFMRRPKSPQRKLFRFMLSGVIVLCPRSSPVLAALQASHASSCRCQ